MGVGSPGKAVPWTSSLNFPIVPILSSFTVWLDALGLWGTQACCLLFAQVRWIPKAIEDASAVTLTSVSQVMDFGSMLGDVKVTCNVLTVYVDAGHTLKRLTQKTSSMLFLTRPAKSSSRLLLSRLKPKRLQPRRIWRKWPR